MDIQGMLKQVIGGGQDAAVGQAVEDHVGAMDGGEVSDHLQTAADNAAANGQPDVAHEIGDLISQFQSDPQALKAGAISYVTSNPQVLEHFAPGFAQGILSKL